MDGKSSQSYSVNTGVPQGSILGFTHFLLHINDLPDDVICIIAVYADDTTLYSKCDQASDRPPNLNLIYEALWTWAGNCLLISVLAKLNWFRLTVLITLVLLMRKWMGLFLRENHLIAKKLGLPFYSRLDCGSSIVSIAKAASKKMEPWDLFYGVSFT